MRSFRSLARSRSLPAAVPCRCSSCHPIPRSNPASPTSQSRTLRGIKSAVTRTLTEVELYGSLRVIETPGHLHGHLSFLDERDSTLYAGDAIICLGNLRVAGYAPFPFTPTNAFTWDKELALRSAQKLMKYPIARFASGHGPIREGGLALLRSTLAKVDQR